MKHTVDTFFSCFSGLKPNLAKSEIADIGVLKGFQVIVCVMRGIDLNNDAFKILHILFSHNEKSKRGKEIFKTVTDI